MPLTPRSGENAPLLGKGLLCLSAARSLRKEDSIHRMGCQWIMSSDSPIAHTLPLSIALYGKGVFWPGEEGEPVQPLF